jgi:dihydroxyacetone synthase
MPAATTPPQESPLSKGHTHYGKTAIQSLLKEEDLETETVSDLSPQHDLVLKTFRLLIADLCQQFKGGHPGGAIGMAAIGVALWRYVMRYAPHTPEFFNRDRFVLSNGHTCLFQYAFLHLTGYKDMTFDQLKSYHSSRVDALCPGHPEIEHEGIEVTTGPLGQGVANAVGLAMATKHLAATFNRPSFDVVSNHTWCMIGDACLQEGVALEAISLAGHLKLNNLTIIYDNNQVTCDGSVDLTNTEDVNAKMEACGWDVIDIEHGCFDIPGLVVALKAARKSRLKPTFINVRTIIGLGSAVADDAVAHGAAFGVKDVADMKTAYNFDPNQHFVIGDEVREFFQDLPSRGEKMVREWEKLRESYSKEYPQLAAEFQSRVRGELPSDWKSLIPFKIAPDTRFIGPCLQPSRRKRQVIHGGHRGSLSFCPHVIPRKTRLPAPGPPNNMRHQWRLHRPIHSLWCP